MTVSYWRDEDEKDNSTLFSRLYYRATTIFLNAVALDVLDGRAPRMPILNGHTSSSRQHFKNVARG